MISVRIFGTPVKAKLIVLPILVALWGGVTWAELSWHPERGLWQSLLIGLAVTLLLLVVDFGHALAHIFSARWASAPMDEILISGDMPRTLYRDNNVSPNTHRLRALGGPIFNVIGLLLSIAIYEIFPNHPVARELMAWSAVGHGLLLIMSLSPLPIVDGGTILKWTLVAGGRTEALADRIVRRVDWLLGSMLILIGIGLLSIKVWIIGLILIGLGIVVLGVTAGKLQ